MKVIQKHKKAIMVAFFFFVFTRLKNNSNNSVMTSNFKFTEQMAKDALLRFAKKNKERAKLLEKMYRAETYHFRSKQFYLTGSAGMEDGDWGGYLKRYFPNGYSLVQMPDNKTKQMRPFVVWNSIDNFLQFLSDYIDRNNGDYLRWNAINTPQNQVRRSDYQNLLNSIKNRFVI